MKIPNLTLEFSENDILSIVNNFVDPKKIAISSIKLSENTIINGILLIKSLKIPFICEFIIESISKNNINIKIIYFKLVNMALPTALKELATKSFFSNIETEGIEIFENLVRIDFKKLLSPFNIKNIEICDLNISKQYISFSLQNICSNKSLDELIKIIM